SRSGSLTTETRSPHRGPQRARAIQTIFSPRLSYMTQRKYLLSVITLVGILITLLNPSPTRSQELSREQWGGMPVTVSHQNGKWIIAGKKNTVTINESDLAMKVQAGAAVWQMVPSSANDLLIRSRGTDSSLRLADAARKTITLYDAGFKTGVKIVLSGWRHADL